MSPRRAVLLHFSARGASAPAALVAFAEQSGRDLLSVDAADDVLAWVNRSHPAAIVVDASESDGSALELCQAVKQETFTAVVPIVLYVDGAEGEVVENGLAAGADEVLDASMSERETTLRLGSALRRAERDVSVHPTTRLPGTGQIERDFAERLAEPTPFAVCYADLDHFKEFNDRYGYNHGDRVILLVSRILRDVVRAHSPGGFIGHIGGDDFIFTVPLEDMQACCGDVLIVFDELMPLQYTAEDRERGYFLGKDRRGVEYEVPLMTLSIGVVTNEQRCFGHPAEIGELATEMKSYAKTLPGSVYAVDRRTN